MKICFLDLDGVLVTGDTPTSLKRMAKVDGDYLCHFNSKCVKALNQLIEKSNAKIVISSTWRKSTQLSTLIKHFKNEGVIGEIIGETPILYDTDKMSVYRGIEIQCWISRHDHENIESFVIIDDDSDMCHLLNRLVKTTMRDYEKLGKESEFTYKELSKESGFTIEHIEKAIEILNRPIDNSLNL